MTFTTRQCNRCWAYKDLSEYPEKCRTTNTSRLATCSSCYKERRKELYRASDRNAKQRETTRLRRSSITPLEWFIRDTASRYKTRYGITYQDWEDMIRDQMGLCGICEKQMQQPHIDHCHDTGKVRGLLCPTCNRGLGLFGDTASGVSRAMRYLESPPRDRLTR